MSDAVDLVTTEQFLRMDFGPDKKAELDHGVVRMMAGGAAAHARVQANVLALLRSLLRGSGCRPYGSDMALEVSDFSVRYPDVAVYCRGAGAQTDDSLRTLKNPTVVVEVLSPSTETMDQSVKLWEYQAIASVESVVFIDPDKETVRVITRLDERTFRDERLLPNTDIVLEGRAVRLPWGEVFSRE